MPIIHHKISLGGFWWFFDPPTYPVALCFPWAWLHFDFALLHLFQIFQVLFTWGKNRHVQVLQFPLVSLVPLVPATGFEVSWHPCSQANLLDHTLPRVDRTKTMRAISIERGYLARSRSLMSKDHQISPNPWKTLEYTNCWIMLGTRSDWWFSWYEDFWDC